MNTDRPTVELFFVLAFTYCKLRVYKEDATFARRVLEARKVEFLDPSDSESWEEIDTRVLLHLVGAALPKLIADAEVLLALGIAQE